MKDFLIKSEGKKYPNPRFYKRTLKRLKRLQRSLSRKVKGSNNRNKQRLLVARAHEKVVNQRLDMQHKLSLQLTCDNQVVAVEDLHIKGMVKNRKLAQAISDSEALFESSSVCCLGTVSNDAGVQRKALWLRNS